MKGAPIDFSWVHLSIWIVGRIYNRNNEYDCSKAERELDFHCRPFSESIRDTVTWLREEGFLMDAKEFEVIEISPAAVLSLPFK